METGSLIAVPAFGNNDAGDSLKKLSALGTSMAAPQVAAAIALMYAVDYFYDS